VEENCELWIKYIKASLKNRILVHQSAIIWWSWKFKFWGSLRCVIEYVIPHISKVGSIFCIYFLYLFIYLL